MATKTEEGGFFRDILIALNYFKRFRNLKRTWDNFLVNKLESLACSMGVLCTQNKLKDYLLFVQDLKGN